MATKKMTKKTREALIGLMPMRLDAEHTFTPKTFDDVEGLVVKPTITIKQWDNKTIHKYRNEVLKEAKCMNLAFNDTTGDVDVPDFTEAKLAIIEGFVVGWSGFIDPFTNEDLPFSFDEVKNLRQFVISDIVNELAIISGAELRD